MPQTSIANAKSPWLYQPTVDLLIGCGGWTIPLFALTALIGRNHTVVLSVLFYGLSLVFNYPHYMATIYRAYHRRADFAKYRRYTLHATLLIVFVLILGHWSYRLLPWIFTLYVIWSPWHYSGQNYGLAMMFVGRAGAKLTLPQRRGMKMMFVSSYVMLAIGFLSQPSVDPLVLSFGLPYWVTNVAQWFCFLLFLISSAYAIVSLWRQLGARSTLPTVTLVASQFLWFVIPVLVSLTTAYQLPPARYSAGILAILHSAQYLWITSYFARRESQAVTNSPWRPLKYSLTLIAGGIALFLPGPWLISYIGHYDFTSSFIIFTALMNIHHFILDGVVWKLHEPQVASLLIDDQSEEIKKGRGQTDEAHAVSRRPAYSLLRIALPAAAVLLISLGIVDLYKFYLGGDVSKPERLASAIKLNPNDSIPYVKLAQSAIKSSDLDGAVISMRKAIDLNPKNPVTENALAQLLLENQRYVEAFLQYQKMRNLNLMDVNALVNYGILASENNNYDEAIASLTQALKIDPTQLNARLYLADTLNKQGNLAASIPQYEKYLTLVGLRGGNVGLTSQQIIHISTALADAYSKEKCSDCQERANEYRKKAEEFTAMAKEASR